MELTYTTLTMLFISAASFALFGALKALSRPKKKKEENHLKKQVTVPPNCLFCQLEDYCRKNDSSGYVYRRSAICKQRLNAFK